MKFTTLFLCALIPSLLAAVVQPPSPAAPDNGSSEGFEGLRECAEQFIESGCLPDEIPQEKPTPEEMHELYECLVDSDDVSEECKDTVEDMKICHDLVVELCGEPSADKDFRDCIRSEDARNALDDADCKPPRHRGPGGRGGRGGRGNRTQTQFASFVAETVAPGQDDTCRDQIKEACDDSDNFPDCALNSNDVEDECKQKIQDKQKCKEIVESLCGEPSDDKDAFRKCMKENKDALKASGCHPPRRGGHRGGRGNRQKRNFIARPDGEDDGCRDQIKAVCDSKEDFPGCALNSADVEQSCKDKIEEKQKCRDLVESLCGKPSGKGDQTFRKCMEENKDKLAEAECKPPRRPRKD